MRALIHALKYSHIRPVANRLGALLAQAVLMLREEAAGELLVVPKPLHHKRRRERGFNQSEELARCALRVLRHSAPEWQLKLAPRSLMRIVNTPPQAGQTSRQRRINLRRAFAVAESEAVHGRRVLLIDDVLTTGATARSASQELLRAGAETVWVATLARATRAFPVYRGSDFYEDDAQWHDAATSSVRLDSLQGQHSF